MRRLWFRPTWADRLLMRGARPILTRTGGLEAFGRCGIALVDFDPLRDVGAWLFRALDHRFAVVYRTDDEKSDLYAVDLRRSAVSVWTPFVLLFGWFVRFRKEVAS